MTIHVEAVLDVAEQVLYDNIVKFLPSISAETRAEKAKELGQEPLCRENVNERIFKLGVRAFLQQFEDSGGNVYSAVVKEKVLTAYTNTARALVDVHAGFLSKMKAAEEKHGKDSVEYKVADAQYTAVCFVIAHVDREFLGGDAGDGILPEEQSRKPGGKNKKPQRRKRK